MAKPRTYARDAEAALNGFFVLNLDERGAYGTVLDMLYATGNKVPDDDEEMAHWCKCSVEKWQAIKARLCALGKIIVVDGLIHNPRADRELGKIKPARAKPAKPVSTLPMALGAPEWPADAFERFWAVYPRRAGRGQAEKALKAVQAARAVDFEVMLDAVRRYAIKMQGSEPQFTCHPATWLNGKRWTDNEGAIGHGRRRGSLDAEMDDV